MCAQVAAHRRRRRLVEQREPLVDLAALDERAALAGEREHLHVAVTDPLGELEGLVEERHRAVEVALGEHRRERVGEQEPTVLRRLGLVFEQALGVCEPASGDGEGATALVVPARA